MMANSSFPIEEDASIRIGREIMSFINKKDLSFKLDSPTQADGDCFVHAVIQQLHRPSIAGAYGQDLLSVNLQEFRLRVRDFILNSSHPRVTAVKATFDALEGVSSENGSRAVDIGMPWEDYWTKIVISNTWAEFPDTLY